MELDPLVGKKINDYSIVRLIGQGGMGKVYEAVEENLERKVALKVLREELSTDAEFVKRFAREAKAAARLNHPNIVQIHAFQSLKGLHFFTMQYIEGHPLSDLLEEGKSLPLEEAVDIIIQAAMALAHSHKEGIIHRDIKPSNLLIDPQRRVLVADFGLAKSLLLKSDITTTTKFIGTPRYASPEQFEGHEVDQRSDIYSLGVIFYQLLSGHFPYQADTPASLVRNVVAKDPLPIQLFNPSVPTSIDKILKKMLAKKPDKRYQSADELLKDLHQFKAYETPVRPLAIVESRTTLLKSLSRVVDESVMTRLRSLQKMKKALVLTAVVTLLAFLLMVFLAIYKPDSLKELFRKDVPPQGKASASAPIPVIEGERKEPSATEVAVGDEVPPTEPLMQEPPAQESIEESIGVLSFNDLKQDPESSWLASAIPIDINTHLSKVKNLKVHSPEEIAYLRQKKQYTDVEIAKELGITKMLTGSFIKLGDEIRIEVHITDISTMALEASEVIEGDWKDIFTLQKQLASKIIDHLPIPPVGYAKAGISEPTSTDMDWYKQLLEAEGKTSPVSQEKPEEKPEGQPSSRIDKSMAPTPMKEGLSLLQDKWSVETFFLSQAMAAEEAPEPQGKSQKNEKAMAEEEIRTLLDSYKKAFETSDIEALTRIYKVFPSTQREAVERYFNNIENLQIILKDIQIELKDAEEAVVNFTRTDDFVDKSSQKKVHLEMRLTKILEKEDDGWRMIQ